MSPEIYFTSVHVISVLASREEVCESLFKYCLYNEMSPVSHG